MTDDELVDEAIEAKVQPAIDRGLPLRLDAAVAEIQRRRPWVTTEHAIARIRAWEQRVGVKLPEGQ